MRCVGPCGGGTCPAFGGVVCLRLTAFAVLCCLPRCAPLLLAASAGPVAEGSAAVSAGRWSAAAVPPKVRRYAQRLVRRYDLNGDGQLQSDEWGKMQGSPAAADANRDGVITLDEWVRYLATFGQNRQVRPAGSDAESDAVAISGDKTPRGPANASEGPSSKAAEVAKKATTPATNTKPKPVAREPSVRDAKFHIPRSRLPAGLPPWFLQRDANGDGQVSLSEFAPDAAQTALQEFLRYDKNGDGFITPQECSGSPKPPKASSAKATGVESPETKADR